MSLQIENLEKNMAKLTIEVPAEEFEAAMQKAYNNQKGKISIPGFRKGKVPYAYLLKAYGPEMFYEEAANIVMPNAYADATDSEECTLDIVSRPEIDVVQMEKGKNFIFTATVAVKPEVTLGEYKGIKVEKATVEVTDEDIDAELKKVQDQNSRMVTVEDRAVEDGDTVNIDYAGSIDGVAFEGGTAVGQPLVIGSHTFIDNFEEQIIGHNIGDEFDVNVTFPAEYHAEELAGKPAVFHVKVNSITKKELPEINDEFAQDVSEFDSLDAYKEDIKAKLLEKKEAEAKAAKEDKVVETIVANATMEIPDAMLATQQAQMADEFAQRLSYQGLQIEQYFQFTGLNQETFLEQMKPQALKRIQTRLVLEAVVAAENIEATEAEFDEEIAKMAQMYQMEADQVKSFIGENEKQQMMKDIAVQKAVTFVTDAAVEE
ncbi:MAG TPA: trigger factor [Lachnospiraceae bacterium]|nr:trigger factor [Lachnospiraceae bacterium]HIS62800.1 trigger factor [Candidatus Scybalomonas excrementigallinarum]